MDSKNIGSVVGGGPSILCTQLKFLMDIHLYKRNSAISSKSYLCIPYHETKKFATLLSNEIKNKK